VKEKDNLEVEKNKSSGQKQQGHGYIVKRRTDGPPPDTRDKVQKKKRLVYSG
jgi:hypothetical protein